VLRPFRTQVFAGNQVAREKGEGIEFADMRPFAPGDRVRRVNWRASARRGELWVNEYHAERNGDVVLAVLDDGTGLHGAAEGTGLSIVRALVRDELRGEIHFATNGGSRAEVVFPA
jgi:uncharacterized protein (DUF58 family)